MKLFYIFFFSSHHCYSHFFKMFIHACSSGNLAEAKRIYSANPSVDVSMSNEYAFRMACCDGHLLTAKWLLEIKPTINISAEDNFAFRTACSNGHLPVAQWLLEIKPAIISADNVFKFTFQMACWLCRLFIAQWLLEIKPTINISADDEIAFRGACFYGHLPVIKWLLEIKPTINISAEDNYAFRKACYNYHLPVAHWFLQLNPYRYEITMLENNKYNKFKFKGRVRTQEEAKEARWQHLKYAVWAASDASPNRNSLLYKLPFDVSKRIIQFV